MKIWIFIVKFIFIGSLFIVSNHNLYLSEASDRELFIDYFSSWLGKLYEKSSEITGYVVSSAWLPDKNLDFSLE